MKSWSKPFRRYVKAQRKLRRMPPCIYCGKPSNLYWHGKPAHALCVPDQEPFVSFRRTQQVMP